MLCLLLGPPGFNCLFVFFVGIELYVLLSHYLCFNSFLYLDLYVLGDGSWYQTSMCLDPRQNLR